MDIYSILSSKPHNSHYLNKYIQFITRCQQKNQGYQGYTERHHICPKSMFPEYRSFIYNPWNCVILTARQHFIAHMILWKTYNNAQMTRAFGAMSSNFDIKNSKLYQNIREKYSKIVSKQMKNTVTIRNKDGKCTRIDKSDFDSNHMIYGSTKGMTYAIDMAGNSHYVKKDDPRFATGELKGNNAGTITITNGKTNKRIKPEEFIPEGWHRGMTKDSPKDSVWFNDGKISKMFKGNQIPEGWVKGRLYKKKPKHVGTVGKKCINNGIVNKMIEKEKPIPEGWVKGRLFVKK